MVIFSWATCSCPWAPFQGFSQRLGQVTMHHLTAPQRHGRGSQSRQRKETLSQGNEPGGASLHQPGREQEQKPQLGKVFRKDQAGSLVLSGL